MAVVGDSDAHFSIAVQRELERQREKSLQQRVAIAEQKEDLNRLLADMGKASHDELRHAKGGDGSVPCYPLVADAPDVATRQQLAEGGAEVYGLVPSTNPAFPACKAYARAVPDAADRGSTAELRQVVRKLSERVGALEDDNALRSLEVRVLRRILSDHVGELRLCPQEVDALTALGTGPSLPHPSSPSRDADDVREAQERAVDSLAREGLGSLLRAVYSEPKVLRSLGHVPGV
eukprot:TRINITY_DN44756_c0_g1_i1.p1 TRINITY_DN44756_c0_g1~~TRINITY_DN44756_c0_g1_i1.p1  ORF type:complete len:253 (+),score=77.10 TRINITY_DN44756_c0_g1_i1:60-761(+)